MIPVGTNADLNTTEVVDLNPVENIESKVEENNNVNISEVVDDSYLKNDRWLEVYVARKVGKSDINQLELEDYRSITELVLPNKGIKYLPKEIGYMSNLRILDLSGNEIKEVPDTIQYLTSVEDINLSNNNISNFSKGISELTHKSNAIKKINLSDNELMFELDNIYGIKNGVMIDLSQNPMSNSYGGKQLILNNKTELEYSKGDNVDLIKKDLLPHLRFYNTTTGEITRISSNVDINIVPNDDSLFQNGVISKGGEYNISIGIKDASLINGMDNKALTVYDIKLKVKSDDVIVDNYKEKLVKVKKIKAFLRDVPNLEANIITEIKYGEEIKVVGEDNGFYKVYYGANLGYILKDDVEEKNHVLKEVSVPIANVYALKTLDSPVLATATKGQVIKAYPGSGEWTTVLYGGKIAYMKTSDLRDTVAYVGKITVEKAKVRETPSDKSNAIGMMAKGDRVEILEIMDNGWCKIKYLNKVGYIKRSELSVDSEIKVPGDNVSINTNVAENPGGINKPATGDSIFEDFSVFGLSAIAILLVNNLDRIKRYVRKGDE